MRRRFESRIPEDKPLSVKMSAAVPSASGDQDQTRSDAVTFFARHTVDSSVNPTASESFLGPTVTAV